jgi:hypothetical protein
MSDNPSVPTIGGDAKSARAFAVSNPQNALQSSYFPQPLLQPHLIENYGLLFVVEDIFPNNGALQHTMYKHHILIQSHLLVPLETSSHMHICQNW